MSQDEGTEVARLREDLELSRRELADSRLKLEAALEEAADERRRREQAEAELAALGATSEDGRPQKLGRLTDRLRRQAQ